MQVDPQMIKEAVCDVAGQLGFSDCRVAVAEPCLYGEEFLSWLGAGMNAGMEWLARTPQRRLDPRMVLEGCKSVICLSYDYGSLGGRSDEDGQICTYAHGKDYHEIIEEKLADVAELLELYGGCQRCYVDAGPVLERSVAQRCGLGWRGKSGMIVRKQGGSRFFIACVLTTLKLPADAPVKNYCGQCRKCVEVCPTNAILSTGLVDSRRCLSYWTIEHKGSIPVEMRPLIGNRIYGCDDCVGVCPWNKGGMVCKELRFSMSNKLKMMSLYELLTLDDSGFATLFRATPIKRIKREGLFRNICVVLGNIGTEKDIKILKNLRINSQMVAEHAYWAINQIETRCFRERDLRQ